MAERCGKPIDFVEKVQEFNPFAEFVRVPNLDSTAYRQPHLAPDVQFPSCACLNLENLSCFEVVDTQFRYLGVTFSNAIALHPSNPAYPVRSGDILLMGAPRNGWLEATFERPAMFVRGFVTSSRQTVMTAYDADGLVLAQTETAGANLAGSDSPVAPNAELRLQVPNIHRVVFRSFDGELTIDDFAFSFSA
jgi:hypothetical protein